VQTPLRIDNKSNLRLGDPIFFRPAKAGEISEHFNEYLIIQTDKKTGMKTLRKEKTYRGLGKRFY
jgi:D-serine deaminase-like pyridoxal phosphate-dependent protein